jgi:hypothetical protein
LRAARREKRAAVFYGVLDGFEGNDDGTFKLFLGTGPGERTYVDIEEPEHWGHTEGEPGVSLHAVLLGGDLYLDVESN